MPKTRARPPARPLTASVRRVRARRGRTRNGKGKSKTRWSARNFRAGDFNPWFRVFIPHLDVAVALIGANAKTIGIDGGARTSRRSPR